MSSSSFNPYAFYNRGNNSPNHENDQVALFVDWDNLVISNYADRGSNRPDLEVLVRCAQQYGTVVIARAYAEWNITADRLEVYKSGIEPIYAPVFHADRDLSGQTSRGKSLADPVMVTDIIDFMHLLPNLGTYVLVTGDKDMVPAVRLARLRGRRVVVIGPDYVANVLQQVSDVFIPYRMLLTQATSPEAYAAFYQQAGYYPSGQVVYPPQVAGQPAVPVNPAAAPATNQRGRRLTGNRRGAANFPPPAPQPYARVMTPPLPPNTPATATPPAAVPYGYYGQPPQVPPAYPTPEAGAFPVVPQPAFVPPATNPALVMPAPTSADVPASAAATAVPTPGGAKNDFSEVQAVIKTILAQRSASGRSQMRARDLKEELLRRIPNFSERRYGFSKFKALLNTAETAGVLQIEQVGHILWVSAPGTPKMQFGSNSAAALDEADTGLEDEISEVEETGAIAADEEAAIAPMDTLAMNAPADSEPELEAAEAADETFAPQDDVVASEERASALPEAPIGAHREKTTSRGTAATPDSGVRPPLLDQPYYEDVIILIDGLRSRNRWLGYELLLSNVRDYLTKQMPETEAKVQAGTILSKLLNDGIIKMAVEVHSRGARKMTVKVAHLQDTNPAVRYILERQKLQNAAPVEVEAAVEAPLAQETAPMSQEAVPAEMPQTGEAEAVQPNGYWGTHFGRQARHKAVEERPTEVQISPEMYTMPTPTFEEVSAEAEELTSQAEALITAQTEAVMSEVSPELPVAGDDLQQTAELAVEPPTENGQTNRHLAPQLAQPSEGSENEDDSEPEGKAEDSEGETETKPVARRAPRRRTTPRTVKAKEDQNMAQPTERPRLNHKLRPHRRPRI